MTNLLNVTVSDGKYTVIQDERERVDVFYYGVDLKLKLSVTTSDLVLALAQEVQELRDRICPVCDNMVKDPAAKACLACLPQMK